MTWFHCQSLQQHWRFAQFSEWLKHNHGQHFQVNSCSLPIFFSAIQQDFKKANSNQPKSSNFTLWRKVVNTSGWGRSYNVSPWVDLNGSDRSLQYHQHPWGTIYIYKRRLERLQIHSGMYHQRTAPQARPPPLLFSPLSPADPSSPNFHLSQTISQSN